MTTRTNKPPLTVSTNLQPGQELRLDKGLLIGYLRPELEKFLAKKKREHDAAAAANSGN